MILKNLQNQKIIVCFQMPVAVKILKGVDGSLEDFIEEVNVMHSLNHPHIIQLFGIVLSNPLMMVMIYNFNFCP